MADLSRLKHRLLIGSSRKQSKLLCGVLLKQGNMSHILNDVVDVMYW